MGQARRDCIWTTRKEGNGGRGGRDRWDRGMAETAAELCAALGEGHYMKAKAGEQRKNAVLEGGSGRWATEKLRCGLSTFLASC